MYLTDGFPHNFPKEISLPFFVLPLIRNASRQFLFSSKFNSSWEWDDDKLTILAKEVWCEHNRMSELKEPISVDLMVEHMLDPLNNQDLKFQGAHPDLTYDYHKSLAQCCIQPSKIMKVINQVNIRSKF